MQGVIPDPLSLALIASLIGLLIAARLINAQRTRQAQRAREVPVVQIREVRGVPDDMPVYLRFRTPTRLPRLQADQFSV